MTNEAWRPVPGYEGRYDVSDHGRVRSWMYEGTGRTTDAAHVLRPTVAPSNGYPTVWLSGANRVRRSISVHRLVAWAFIGPQPRGLVVNHIDGDKANNVPSNLEYVTAGDNVRHAVRTGLRDLRGERNHKAKLTAADVREIRGLRDLCPGRRHGRRTTKSATSQEAIARRFGVSQRMISKIMRGESWVDAI